MVSKKKWKQNKQQKATNEKPSPQPRKPDSPSRLERLGKQAAALSAITLFVGAAAKVVYDVFRSPDIEARSVAVTDPFDIPFLVRNPSYIFPMTETALSCVSKKVVNASKWQFVDLEFVREVKSQPEIGRRETIQYLCPMKDAFQFGPVKSAEVEVIVKYKVRGEAKRHSESFYWDSESRQWSTGRLLD